MKSFGLHSMVEPLQHVLLSRPDAWMSEADPELWHYSEPLQLSKLQRDHDALAALLHKHGVECSYLPSDGHHSADTVFTYDPSLMTPAGVILCNMGKPLRQSEIPYHHTFYQQAAIPIIGEIQPPATFEAGDSLWLDSETLLVGLGFRTNLEGAKQLKRLLAPQNITVHAYDLPVYQGAAACLHLMSLISMLDHKTALVHEPLLPVRLRHDLESKGIQLIVAPAHEFEQSGTLSLNVLAIAPGHCIMVDGFPETARLIRDAGVQLETFSGSELCLKAEGGPTCLTRPLLRG